MRALIPAIAGGMALLTACGSSGGSSQAKRPPSTPAKASQFTTTYGQDAATIESHIPGCTGITSGSIEGGAKSGMVSTASCTLAGHVLILDTWSDAASSDIGATAASSKTTTCYAEGTGWSAFLADDGVPPAQSVLQMQLTNDASGLLAESQNPHPPTNASAQTQACRVVAKALGGTVRTV